MRPELTRITNADDFLNYYWLKEELVQFCRENELPVSEFEDGDYSKN